MNWKLIPLPALILLLCLGGVVRIREQGGEGDGFLMAGAGLILAGLWAAMEILDRGKKEEAMEEHPIKDKAAEAIAKAIDANTKKLIDASEKLDENDPDPKK